MKIKPEDRLVNWGQFRAAMAHYHAQFHTPWYVKLWRRITK